MRSEPGSLPVPRVHHLESWLRHAQFHPFYAQFCSLDSSTWTAVPSSRFELIRISRCQSEHFFLSSHSGVLRKCFSALKKKNTPRSARTFLSPPTEQKKHDVQIMFGNRTPQKEEQTLSRERRFDRLYTADVRTLLKRSSWRFHACHWGTICSGRSETTHYVRLWMETLYSYGLWVSYFGLRIFRLGFSQTDLRPLEASDALTHGPTTIIPAFDLSTSTSHGRPHETLVSMDAEMDKKALQRKHTPTCLPWAWDKSLTALQAEDEDLELDAVKSQPEQIKPPKEHSCSWL